VPKRDAPWLPLVCNDQGVDGAIEIRNEPRRRLVLWSGEEADIPNQHRTEDVPRRCVVRNMLNASGKN